MVILFIIKLILYIIIFGLFKLFLTGDNNKPIKIAFIWYLLAFIQTTLLLIPCNTLIGFIIIISCVEIFISMLISCELDTGNKKVRIHSLMFITNPYIDDNSRYYIELGLRYNIKNSKIYKILFKGF